jgi:hypothetical protein
MSAAAGMSQWSFWVSSGTGGAQFLDISLVDLELQCSLQCRQAEPSTLFVAALSPCCARPQIAQSHQTFQVG